MEDDQPTMIDPRSRDAPGHGDYNQPWRYCWSAEEAVLLGPRLYIPGTRAGRNNFICAASHGRIALTTLPITLRGAGSFVR